ncbi:reprolysin-like metallopeptidase [Flavobacterium capsici]|uniref:M12 family metallo-peptidase n=1 Tax=Flavobacterium capsici TaxID=3075618 RepID=A0AA96EZP9_9FLAO|nr:MULTISPECIES: zinc-dependent metalloprotease family protein [unclassified Flavobacterium]WNM19812.1 M12 family metallo-peptidase [Flavobacterium sp. PMR2A8]WNM21201.1 M12 family metallo-peptidase [Flavobacterium sp. PMTSA4]
MKKILQLVFITTLFLANSYGQGNLWQKVSGDRLVDLPKMERATTPNQYELFSLDFNGLKSQLQNAPLDRSALNSNVIIAFPNPEGKLQNFRIFEAPVMEDGLANKFPGIKSYSGVGVEDPTATIRFSVTLFGLHVMSLSGESGTYYIDTYTKDLNNYIVYSRKNIQSKRTFACHFQDDEEEIVNLNRNAAFAQPFATDGKFRQYRLAMACTIEYAAFHVNAAGLGSGTTAQKKAAVLSAMVVTMTRVNGVYERDMSLRMNLVANNDLIIFIDSDSFTNNSAANLIGESQTVITGAIGSANFDIGHTVSTGGGGLAGLGVVCNSSTKARGITGSPAPVGDPYDIDYVAHEMGHQFGGPHTFSGDGGNCQGNGSNANAVEPASGSTIMAYAGICGPDVQSNSDAYFHAFSIASMNAVMVGTGNCAPQTDNGNTAPTITTLSNYTIPNGTAYVLTGNASDSDGSASLTYCWEQTNAASGTNFPTSTQTTGPVYRSLNPTSSNKRYLPNFQSVLNGNLSPTWEVTPTVARTLNFALTVRDNQTPTGGQTARANMTVNTAAVGPFRVTSPAASASWNTSSSQTITWDVAGTTANNINTANVNILLSTDNGVTFTTLLANTPNDGSQVVTMPSTPAPYCRILVEAVGNIFYAVSPNFSIGYTLSTTCTTFTNNTPLVIPDGAGANQSGGVVNNSIDVSGLSNISDVNIGLNVTHTYPQDLVIQIVHPNQTTFSNVWNRNCAGNDNFNVTLSDGAAAFTCVANMTGTFAPANPLSVFNGLNANGTWRLYTADFYNQDAGQINSWFIEICSQTATLTNETFTNEKNFVIYPNPNNGTFTVQVTNLLNDVTLNVHDIRGRLILTKTIKASGLINEEVSLANAQSGVYLITIEDGDVKTTKKIVVE